ncbi:hypothetical protein PY650_26650 [Rhizobium calliandrae]|uniref:Transposase n=1 Tax=Rhizobium calliandrae TaxID=1312182 RepID=A0ABT7KKJ0_9HYPH|nr:hypothetical protein [Rhizobium calliandrae]MDL2409153.1 hypothetical protein [Rhizobium calliandrae]
MKNVHNTINEARLGIMLNELRLPNGRKHRATNARPSSAEELNVEPSRIPTVDGKTPNAR